jgi:steroid delta-isomerase-like uncharacterized protein
MAEADVNLLRRWFEEVWNQGRTEVMHELLAPDAPVHGVGGGSDMVRGPAEFLVAYEQLKGAFPDIHFTIEQAISQGDSIAVRWSATATHKGDHLGPPASNNTVNVTGMVFARVRDGKMIEGWNNWDMMGLMHTIGATPHEAVVR